MTTIAASAVVALLGVVALARLTSIVVSGVSAGRTYVASRSARSARQALQVSHDTDRVSRR